MEREYLHEAFIPPKTEEDIKKEIIECIQNTKVKLLNANKNFEFANTNELVDYYIFKIKSTQAQLDSLIKLAKSKGVKIDKIA